MPGYQQISVVATGLLTDEKTLLDFVRRGWIKTAEKNGMTFVAGDQRYRAKYILHLRQKKQLSDEQIDLVLSLQRPPYSSADVDAILKEHAPKGKDGTGHPGEAKQRTHGPRGA